MFLFVFTVVEIDLTKKQFYPGTKYYERVRRCLTDSPDMVFDLLLSWQPQGQSMSSVVIIYFYFLHGINEGTLLLLDSILDN